MAGPISVLQDSAMGPVGVLAQQAANHSAPIQIPGVGEILQLLTTRRIREQQATDLLQLHGVLLSAEMGRGYALDRQLADGLSGLWQQVADMSYQRPTADQVLVIANRFGWTEQQLGEALQRLGIAGDWIGAVAEQRFQIPTASDLILFALREVWDPELLVRFGYDQEFPQPFKEWMAKQGFDYEIASPAHEAAGLGPLTWPKAYWWSHWTLPSTSQGINMLQRLRPSLKDPSVPRDPSGELFTMDDLNSLLKANDYPQFWRGKLAALGYNPIGIRNLRNLWKTGLVDEVEVTEIFLDQGYNLRDARLQARLIATEGPVAALASARKKHLQQLVRGYRMGVIGLSEFRRQVYRYTRTSENDIREFDTLNQVEQDQRALTNNETTTLVTSVTLQDRLDLWQKRLAAVRKGFLRGDIDVDQARDQMLRIGVDGQRRDELIDQWLYERTVSRRKGTATQIKKWVREGLITGDDARSRLLAMGYSETESDLFITDAVLESVSRRIQAIQRSAGAVRASRRAANQLARQAQQAQRAAAAQLVSSTNLSRLAGWLRKGYVSPAEFASRAAAIGVEQRDIQHYLDEASILAQQRAADAIRDQQRATGTTPPPRRQPPAATVVQWLKKRIITEAEARTRLLNLGLDQAAVQNFISQATGQGAANGAASGNGS